MLLRYFNQPRREDKGGKEGRREISSRQQNWGQKMRHASPQGPSAKVHDVFKEDVNTILLYPFNDSITRLVSIRYAPSHYFTCSQNFQWWWWGDICHVAFTLRKTNARPHNFGASQRDDRLLSARLLGTTQSRRGGGVNPFTLQERAT